MSLKKEAAGASFAMACSTSSNEVRKNSFR